MRTLRQVQSYIILNDLKVVEVTLDRYVSARDAYIFRRLLLWSWPGINIVRDFPHPSRRVYEATIAISPWAKADLNYRLEMRVSVTEKQCELRRLRPLD